MRTRLVAALLLVAASLANLPVVYLLVARGPERPWWVLGLGFAAMGLAWAAGFHVERKRRALVVALAGVGVLQAAAAMLPQLAGVRAFMLASAALALVGFGLVVRDR